MIWSFFSLQTGAFSGRTYSGAAAGLEANTPPGHAAMEGQHDHLCRRVNLSTGRVVDYKPPKPAEDALRGWAWHAGDKRWHPEPTPLALRQQARAAVLSQIEALEARQARPVRELGLDPGNAEAHAQLAALEGQIAALRATLPAG